MCIAINLCDIPSHSDVVKSIFFSELIKKNNAIENIKTNVLTNASILF